MEYTFEVSVPDSPWPITFALCLPDRDTAIARARLISVRLAALYGPENTCTLISVRSMGNDLRCMHSGRP